MAPRLQFEVVPLSEVPQKRFNMVFDERLPLVLIVDDEPLVADSLSMILSHAGFATLTAYDGETALEIAQAIRPELLISDVAMPGMTGIELAMVMVNIAPQCKVLLFSGHATDADLAEARAAGYSFPLLTKPVHPADMLKQISACLMHRSLAACSVQ